ncbi:hypothetical protein N9N53_04300 [Candidatus Pelagibacter bacterium]|nr:hypothetical protein [Candidatus Pelagibacter bacterium]MDA8836188.1 hypothetical protein [Candidatus Pelagibacter bacterium]
MGEKIKILSKGKISSNNFEIELNHPVSAEQDEQIHVQSNKVRFEMDKKDYIKYALSVLVAAKNLKILKGLK